MKRLHSSEALLKRKGIVIADLRAKVDVEDWHGVADAAMDLREIEAMIAALHLHSVERIGQAEGDY